MTHQINTPDANFPAHADKVQIVKFHPLASDVIVTVGFDKTIKIWNLNETDEPKLELEVRSNYRKKTMNWSQDITSKSNAVIFTFRLRCFALIFLSD